MLWLKRNLICFDYSTNDLCYGGPIRSRQRPIPEVSVAGRPPVASSANTRNVITNTPTRNQVTSIGIDCSAMNTISRDYPRRQWAIGVWYNDTWWSWELNHPRCFLPLVSRNAIYCNTLHCAVCSNDLWLTLKQWGIQIVELARSPLHQCQQYSHK